MNPLIACGMAFGVLLAGLTHRANDPERLERARQWWGGGL